MINKKLMRQWVDALRSRKYKQGVLYLRRTGPTPHSVNRYCCLGVACDLFGSQQWKSDGSCYRYDGNASYLSNDLLNKLGIDLTEQDKLTIMKDTGKKFHEIADYLEKKYLQGE